GSTVLFREPTVWKRYRTWIVAGSSVCAVQALLLFVLLANSIKRRHAERSLGESMEALAESENRLRSLLETHADAIITMNQNRVIQSMNAATERIFGYTHAEVIGQPISLLLPTAFHDAPGSSQAHDPPTGRPKVISPGREVSGRRKQGSVFPIELAVSELVRNDRYIFTAFLREITERKEAERTPHKRRGNVIAAQGVDRARLARELHDDITQRLARLAIDAGRLERQGGSPALGEMMREIRDELVRLSEDVHSLSYKL